MELIEFYKGIIESTGLIVKEDGSVNLQLMPGEYIPYSVNDKRLVLPTPDILRDPDWEHQIAFHPLSENIARKDSAIFRELTRMINLSLNVDIGLIVGRMVELCADKDQHKNMNHRQTAFLSLFPNADNTSFKNWEKIQKRVGIDSDNSFIKLITLRNKELEGQTYARVAFVKFPYYKALVEMTDTDKNYELNGVKLRKKDALGFRKLMEYVLNGIGEPDKHYSYGSRSLTAPSFHALVTSFTKVGEELSRTFNLLKMDYYNLYWKTELDNLAQFKGVVPSLDGNEGDITEGEKRRNAISPQVQSPSVQQPVTIPQQPQPAVVQQPMVQPGYPMMSPVSGNKYVQPTAKKTTPTVSNTSGSQVTIPVTPKVGNQVKPPVTIPVNQPTVQQPVNHYQQPMYQQPMMYQQPQPQVVQVPGQPPKMVDSMGRPVAIPGYQSNLVPAGAPQMGYAPMGMAVAQPMMNMVPAGQPNLYNQPMGVPYFPGYPVNNMPVYR